MTEVWTGNILYAVIPEPEDKMLNSRTNYKNYGAPVEPYEKCKYCGTRNIKDVNNDKVSL